MSGIHIVGTGRAVPSKCVTNDDLSKIVDTNDEWITTRTGIKKRNFCDKEKNYDLALQAANKAIEKSGISKEDISVIIVATFTPDYATPSVACMVQKGLGLTNGIPAFDINAACSGFLYGLEIANSMLKASGKRYALVIGSEQISTRLDMNDRGTCVLFGDGAGAAVVEVSDECKFVSVLGSEGNDEALGCNGQTSDNPYIFMDGKQVFKFAVKTISTVSMQTMEKAGVSIDDLDYVICHQANQRIINSVIKHLGAPEEKFYVNIFDYGNTSAASIAIALDEMFEKNMLKPGMKVLMVGFGAGFTWGGIYIEI